MTKALSICNTLLCRLKDGGVAAQVHSAFDHAINFSTPIGLLTLLAFEKPLQPYSVRLIGGLPRWCGGPLSFADTGVFDASGVKLICFTGAGSVDLSICPSPAPTLVGAGAGAVLDFLRNAPVAESIDGLVLGGSENSFTAFLKPRLPALRLAAMTGRGLPEAAAAFAGCGAGLTPSSDDFLCGYLAAAFAFGRLSPALLRKTAEAAAAKTNDISGAILRRLGDGLVSAPVLALLAALQTGAALPAHLAPVADIGSTSGRDTLTGICLSLFDIGGEAV